jgi:guanylate kinase
MIRILTLSGVSGAGKTTIMELLTTRPFSSFVPVLSTTTRQRRPTDMPGEYEYVSFDQFEVLRHEQRFEWIKEVSNELYGTKKEHLDRFLFQEKCVGVMILVPDIVPILKKYAANQGRGSRVISFFIETPPEEIQYKRLSKRGDPEHKIKSRIAECRGWQSSAVSQLRCFDMYIDNSKEDDGEHATNSILELVQLCKGVCPE